MKWLPYLFAGFTILLALPIWRLIDWALLMLPFPALLQVLYLTWFSIFILIPILIIIPRFRLWVTLFSLLIYGVVIFNAPNFTKQTTLGPELSHCGSMSYTGFFYPVRTILSSTYQDDLEARNQVCWLMKMIQKIPEKIPADEFEPRFNLVNTKLMKPLHRYRSSLPWIAFLVGKYLAANDVPSSKMGQIQDGKLFVESMKNYSLIYSDMISTKDFPWYDWPLSSIVKLEYGFIEENWDKIDLEFNP